MLERRQSEIDAQINFAMEHNGKYPGMSYAEGVQAALDWVTGYSDEPPFSPEDMDEDMDDD